MQGNDQNGLFYFLARCCKKHDECYEVLANSRLCGSNSALDEYITSYRTVNCSVCGKLQWSTLVWTALYMTDQWSPGTSWWGKGGGEVGIQLYFYGKDTSLLLIVSWAGWISRTLRVIVNDLSTCTVLYSFVDKCPDTNASYWPSARELCRSTRQPRNAPPTPNKRQMLLINAPPANTSIQ